VGRRREKEEDGEGMEDKEEWSERRRKEEGKGGSGPFHLSERGCAPWFRGIWISAELDRKDKAV